MGKLNSKSARAIVRLGVSLAALTVGAAGGAAYAQGVAAPQNDTATAGSGDVVVVTGYRKSLQAALSMKRNSDVMLDAINADDIASFPEANLAESLQRIPGISIDRDNGEGRQISVRGLGGDFTRVRINGMEALSTSGSNDAGSSPNRSRAFDFNAFASELFSNAQVRKTNSADTDEGSLGATVDLNTGHPFDYKGMKFALNLEDAYYENGKHHQPRISGLWSTRWAGGKLGFLISGAYQKRATSISQYQRGPGSSDFVYRGASDVGAGTNSCGTTTNACTGTTAGVTGNQEYPQYGGFAVPVSMAPTQIILSAAGNCPNTTGPSQPVGTICNVNPWSNPEAFAAQTGSDLAAYMKLYPAGLFTPGRFDDSRVIFPALPSLTLQELQSERVGITSSFQWQASNNTRVTVDFMLSHFRNESINYQVGSVGLNRNNTSNVYNTMTAASPTAVKRSLYPGACTAAAEGMFSAPQDCGATLYGTTPAFATGVTGVNALTGAAITAPAVLGTNIFSVNPYNLDPYDYYNNPNSVGYAPNLLGVNGRAALIGRPAVKVLDANVTNGVADYLKLSNVDWRSGADGGFYTTDFNQTSVNVDHRFSENFKMVAVLGLSKSTNVYEGKLVEFNAMDVAGPMIYDERGSPETMPTFNPGFDVADPTKWGIVKGMSAMRHYVRHTENSYAQFKVDFDWAVNDTYDVKFGGNVKKFGFYTDQFERNADNINPTEKEAGVTVASLGSVHQYGQGLDLAAGTPTAFFTPDFDAFSKVFGFDCSCINKYGDFRITVKRNNTATFSVYENDSSMYGQVNFKYDIFGRDLTGNVGVRVATTDVLARGRTNAGRPLEETNHYTDTLPSLNLNYHVLDNLYMRIGASKAMARPLLGNLSPSVSSISIPTGATAVTGGTLTVGNTQLKPFRSTNYDWNLEWYFDKNSLLSFALFDKEVESYPQTILFDSKLSDFLDQDSIDALKANLSGTNAGIQAAYIDNGLPFTARQVRDAPGGTLWGWEFTYQQEMTFLPGFWKDFGIQLNATHIGSKLTYIIDPGVKSNGVYTVQPTFASGPWLNASPDAVNFTLYYEVPQFSTRVSVSHRAGYYTTFPIAAGTCSVGLQAPSNTSSASAIYATSSTCDGPLLLDFLGSRATTNVDANFMWNFNKNLALKIEGLNLTNQTSQRYGYVANPVVTGYGSSGRQITVGVRYKY